MCPEHRGICKCANWHYEKFDGKGKASKVLSRCTSLLVNLRNEQIDRKTACVHTQATHLCLFNGLTRKGCELFAGHFRGSKGCLKNYAVTIGSGKNAIATTSPSAVDAEMAELSDKIAADFDALVTMRDASALLDISDLTNWLDIALERMISFLSIHPYADGNGHVGRFMMFCYLSAVGVWPNGWPLDDHPPHPYDEAIAAFRNGYVDGLRDIMLQHISWQPPTSPVVATS